MNPDRPTLYLRFPNSRFPLVEMRVRVLPDTVQVEYSLGRSPESIYIQKQTQYFDFAEEMFLQELWNGQGWDWELLDRLSRRYELEDK